jgi:hypothetical protein
MPKQSLEAIEEALVSLRKEYRKRRTDYHESRYEMLGTAMKIVVEIRDDEAHLPKMLRRLRARPRNPRQRESNLTDTVVEYVTSPSTENGFKIAWKYARVLEYLHDHKKVPLAHLAREIKLRGGIEKLTRKATKEFPRRNKHPTNKEASKSSNRASAELRCSIRPKVAKKLRSIATGTEVRLIGIRTAVRGFTTGAIVEVRKIVRAGR